MILSIQSLNLETQIKRHFVWTENWNSVFKCLILLFQEVKDFLNRITIYLNSFIESLVGNVVFLKKLWNIFPSFVYLTFSFILKLCYKH